MSKQPTKEPQVPSESTRHWIDKEAQFLTGVLCGGCRSRKYRHHIFFQDAAEVLRRTLSLSAKLNAGASDDAHRRQAALLLRKCVVAGESSVNELRLHRVDTIPVALALLAVMARLHALWTAALETSGPLSTGLRRQIQREQLSAVGEASDASTIGGMVDVLTARHIESGALQGRKRHRDL